MEETEWEPKKIRLVMGPLDNKIVNVRGPGPWWFPMISWGKTKAAPIGMHVLEYSEPNNRDKCLGVYKGVVE